MNEDLKYIYLLTEVGRNEPLKAEKLKGPLNIKQTG